MAEEQTVQVKQIIQETLKKSDEFALAIANFALKRRKEKLV